MEYLHRQDEAFREIIRNELNVKSIVFTDKVDDLRSYNFKPQLKTLGPKYGKRLGEIRTMLAELDGGKAKAELDANGQIVLASPNGDIVLTAEDLLIETKQTEGFESVADKNVIVEGDGSTVVNVYYSRNYYKIYIKDTK